jgi:hypothetical protein
MRALALVCGAGLLSPSAAVAASSTVPVSVHPRWGGTMGRFTVVFRAPDSSGAQGSSTRSFHVTAARRGGTTGHCTASQTVALAQVQKGQRVRVVLAPRGRWCQGRFAGRVWETVTPACHPGQLCPLFIAEMTVGRFSFRVK